MSATHIPLNIRGTAVGDLITVGHQVVLFTVKAAFRRFDGMTFRSADDAVAALNAILDQADAAPAAASAIAA